MKHIVFRRRNLCAVSGEVPTPLRVRDLIRFPDYKDIKWKDTVSPKINFGDPSIAPEESDDGPSEACWCQRKPRDDLGSKTSPQ